MNQLAAIKAPPNRSWTEARPCASSGSADPSPLRNGSETAEKIEQTISYMMDHLDRPLQVATLAALACVSPSHYFALFKRRTGSAPMDYFTRLRMERARTLLNTTNRTVKEVAAALGYDDPFYFSRVFKAVTQLSPSLYRQRLHHAKNGLTSAGSLARSIPHPMLVASRFDVPQLPQQPNPNPK